MSERVDGFCRFKIKKHSKHVNKYTSSASLCDEFEYPFENFSSTTYTNIFTTVTDINSVCSLDDNIYADIAGID